MADLYFDWLPGKYPEEKPVSRKIYRNIFNTSLNIGFHKPKKDLCSYCTRFKNGSATEKQKLQSAQDFHLGQKKLSRENKTNDKLLSTIDETVKVFTIDLQAVLNSPCSNVSTLYYSRKFATYNFTIYDLASGAGHCIIWNENDAARGSDEIGTILFKFLKNLPTTIKKVILYSDCCGGQNRNKFLANILLHAVKTLDLEEIHFKYLESGHTEMEVDSMHSAIEKMKSNIDIYCPTEWPTIIRMARRNNPYDVKCYTYSDFLNLKKFREQTIKGEWTTNSNGEKLSWLKIKYFKFMKSKPKNIYYKVDYAEENFKSIDVKFKKGYKNVNIEPKYQEKLNISKLKFKDLKKLCDTGVIPECFHNFYKNLSFNSTQRDYLCHPDVEDEIEDEENIADRDHN